MKAELPSVGIENPGRLQPLAIFLVVSSIYLLTYSGLFRSIDELVVLTMTDRLVQGGNIEPFPLQFISFHIPAASPLRFEPLVALVFSPIYFLALHVPAWGNIQVLMLFNLMISAATGAILWTTLQEMGHSARLATFITLLASLGTMAWPYSRTLFREPLVCFFSAAAFLFWIRYRKQHQLRWAWACLAAFILAVGIKMENLLLLSPLLLSMMGTFSRHRRRAVMGWGIAGIATSAVLLVSMDYRFGTLNPGTPFASYYATKGLEEWVTALYGLTFSPGKGLFLYSPLLLLGLIGILHLHQKRATVARVVLGIFLLHLAFYALLANWWGGTAWGPRYLLPLWPLLAISLVESWTKGRIWKWAIVLLALVSIAIQFVSSTAPWAPYYQSLSSRYPQPETSVLLAPQNWALSPILGQFASWPSQKFDILWWQNGSRQELSSPDWPLLIIALFLLVMSLGFLFYTLGPRLGSRPGAAFLVVGASYLVGAIFFLNQGYQLAGTYRGQGAESLRIIGEEINKSSAQRQLIVSISSRFGHNTFLNFLKGSFDYYWFSPLQQEGFEILIPLMADGEKVFLISDGLPPGTSLEKWLNTHQFRYNAHWVGRYLFLGYISAISLPIPTAVGAHWEGGIELASYSLAPQTLGPGAPILLEMHFRTSQKIQFDYDVFLHLTTPSGTVMASTDGPPQFGAAPTSGWVMGSEIRDLRAILLPRDLPPGEYLIEVGFYRGAERLPLRDEGGQSQDRVIIDRVVVE